MNWKDHADAVKRSVSAVSAAEMLGLKANRAGFCQCPIHGEKTGSLKLYPGNRGWHCFGCHRGGSVIDLVMAVDGVDFHGAIREINEHFRLGLPIDGPATEEQKAEAKRRAEEREREQREREARRKAKDEAYLRYLDVGDEIASLEEVRDAYAPKDIQDEWHPKFVEALRRIPELKEEAEDLALVCFGKEE